MEALVDGSRTPHGEGSAWDKCFVNGRLKGVLATHSEPEKPQAIQCQTTGCLPRWFHGRFSTRRELLCCSFERGAREGRVELGVSGDAC